MRIALWIAVSLVTVPAAAQPRVTTTGSIDGPRPLPSTFVLDDQAYLYVENVDVLLEAPLDVDVGPTPARYDMVSAPASGHTIPAQTVTCYMVHFNPSTPSLVAEGSVRMEDDTVLLGVAFTDEMLVATDPVCKPSGVTYPESPESTRGLGFTDEYDWLMMSEAEAFVGMRSAAAYVDQARIIVGRAPSSDAGMNVDTDAGPPGDAGTIARRDAGAVADDDWAYRGSGGCTCATIGTGTRDPWASVTSASFTLALCLLLIRRR